MRSMRDEMVAIGDERGFTLIEVLVSITITLVVMASVFALLTRGQRSFEREPEIADLQQNARNALDMVSKDILQAGAGLPPEFPSFSSINGGDGNPTDSIEMIGTFQGAGDLYIEPEPILEINNNVVETEAITTNIRPGDMVAVCNGIPNDAPTTFPNLFPRWILASVTSVAQNAGPTNGGALITLDLAAYPPAYSNYTPGVDEPMFVDNTVFGTKPQITRVSVVRYFTQLDVAANYNGPPPQVLMRSVDFGITQPPQPVGYLEDFQIAYTIGVTAPAPQDAPPVIPAAPTLLTTENMLSSVRVTVTGRSVTAGMEGASQGALADASDDFIRKTFSTNVNPRNVTAGIETRSQTIAMGN